MKLKNKVTGQIFESIEDAVESYKCPGLCIDCYLKADRYVNMNKCNREYYSEHPKEVALLMNMEMIEE